MKIAHRRHFNDEVMGPVLKKETVSMELQTYGAVHGHAQSDIQSYLQAHQDEAAEIEAELAQEEITVEDERAMTLANITRMQEIAASHEAGYKKMLAKINEGDLEHVAQVQAAAVAARERGVPYPVGDVQFGGKGFNNPERLTNASTVANELVQRKGRNDRFQRRRRSCMNEEMRKLEVLERKHAEADKRAVSRQKELIEKQDEKTFAAQQRRGEQQKLLKEIQKFQEHEFEKLQLKHHPEAVSTHKSSCQHQAVSSTSPPPSRPSSSPSPLDPEGEEEPKSPTEEPIHRHMVQSHKLYNKTLDKWKVFVTDNERRTEAYWLKMLDGEPRKKTGGWSRLKDFRRSVQGLCTVHKFLARTHGSTHELDISADPQDEELLLMTPSSMCSPSSMCLTGSPTYAERLERIRQYQAEKDRQAMEKRDRDVASLENKQQKSKAELKMRSERAKSRNSTWEKKNAVSAEKRQTLATRSDGDIMEKLARQKRELEEKEHRRAEEIDTLKSLRDMHSTNVKTAAKLRRLSMQETWKEQMAAKFERSAENKSLQIIKAVEDSPKARDDEFSKGRVAIKSASEQAFSTSTAQAIEMKKQRHETMKLQVLKPKNPMEAFARQRVLRKEKSGKTSKIAPPELILTPGWDAVPEDLADNKPGSKPDSPSFCLDVQMRKTSSSSSVKRLSPMSLKLGQLSPRGDGPKIASGRSNRSNNHSSDEENDEAEFLAELQCRSAKWLDDLRLKDQF